MAKEIREIIAIQEQLAVSEGNNERLTSLQHLRRVVDEAEQTGVLSPSSPEGTSGNPSFLTTRQHSSYLVFQGETAQKVLAIPTTELIQAETNRHKFDSSIDSTVEPYLSFINGRIPRNRSGKVSFTSHIKIEECEIDFAYTINYKKDHQKRNRGTFAVRISSQYDKNPILHRISQLAALEYMVSTPPVIKFAFEGNNLKSVKLTKVDEVGEKTTRTLEVLLGKTAAWHLVRKGRLTDLDVTLLDTPQMSTRDGSDHTRLLKYNQNSDLFVNHYNAADTMESKEVIEVVKSLFDSVIVDISSSIQ